MPFFCDSSADGDKSAGLMAEVVCVDRSAVLRSCQFARLHVSVLGGSTIAEEYCRAGLIAEEARESNQISPTIRHSSGQTPLYYILYGYGRLQSIR